VKKHTKLYVNFAPTDQDRVVFCCGKIMECFAPETEAAEAIKKVIEE